MPKLTGPLFSAEAHGALGKALTFQRRPGGASVYGYKKPKVPLTDAQLFQRELIRDAVHWWQGLSDGEKAEWEEKARNQGQSGYSYFLKQNSQWAFYSDLALYLPLYDTGLQGNSFKSREQYRHLCTNYGAVWTPQGRSFDGLDNRMEVPDHASLDLASFTIQAWVKLDSISTRHVFVAKINWDATGSFNRWNYNLFQTGPSGVLTLTVWDGTNAVNAVTTEGMLVDQWYFVEGIRNYGVTIQVGLNCVYGTAITDTAGDATNARSLFIGQREVPGSYLYMDGLIGEVWIYNRVLSLAERQNHFLATKWRYQ